MNQKENYLRAVRFQRPEWIPMIFHINAACWHHYSRAALEDLVALYPRLFQGSGLGDPKRALALAPWQRAGQPFTDPWGCVWETLEDGITGAVTHHPLADWAAAKDYCLPDPEASDGMLPIDWKAVADSFRSAASRGLLREGGLRHGHTYLRLCDLRGYENLTLDMADEDPRLLRLIELVEQFNASTVRHHLEAGAELVAFPEDLGMQRGPMLSPAHLRRYIQPSYRRLMEPVRRAGAVVHAHSDGDIRSLAQDLLACGIDVLNLQDLVNGLEWIRDHLKGRVAIDLDIDRQTVTRFGTPEEIDRLIREEVTLLGSPIGGLTMIYGLYPGVPLENATALAAAMDRYSTHFS